MTNTKKTRDEEMDEIKESPTKNDRTDQKAEPDKPKEETPKEAHSSDQEDDASAKYLRLMADFQNYKRRSEKERAEIHAFANEKIVLELLGVVDNFERALEQDTGTDQQFRDGMAMIFDQLKTVLSKSGVEEIQALGQEFDPKFHHAIMMETHEETKSGHVSMVLQKGYTLKGKVIRPSIVKVAE